MPTPAERKALIFLAGMLVLGTGARMQRSDAHSAPPSEASRQALARQIARVDSVRAKAGKKRHSARRVVVRASNGVAALPAPRKHPAITVRRRTVRRRTVRRRTVRGVEPRITVLGGADVVDLDRASAAQIEQLRGLGPVLAKRIVANRDSLGPFGSLAALQRVKGIGPATAKRLAPHVTFSLQPRPSGVTPRVRPARPEWRRRS